MINASKLIAAACFAASALAAAGSESLGPNANPLLVVVSRDSIRTQDLNRLIIATHDQMSNQKKVGFDYEKLLKKVVNDKLILHEAKSMEMQKDEALAQELDSLKISLAVAQYVRKNYKPDLKVSKAEVMEDFNHYYRKLQIRILTQHTLDSMELMYRKIVGGTPMDTLARQVSVDSKKYDGGLYPLVDFADLEIALRDKAVTLKPGGLSKPFPFRTAYAVIRLENFLPADPKYLPKVEEKIRLRLKDAKQKAAWQKFLAGVVAAHPPVLIQANLARIAKDSSKLLSADFLKGDTACVIKLKGVGAVTDQGFRNHLSHYVMEEGGSDFHLLVGRTLTSISAELALKAAVLQQGYLRRPEVVEAYNHGVDSALIGAYLNEMVVKKIRFNKKEFEDYYAQNLDGFRDPDQLLLSQLRVSTRDSAKALVARLRHGADFGYLLAQVCGGRDTLNKNSEWTLLSFYPDSVQAQLRDLKIGQQSDAVQTPDGWIIYSVADRKRGNLRTMEESDMKIRQIMFQKKFSEQLDTVLTALKANASITYYNDNIKNYFGKKN